MTTQRWTDEMLDSLAGTVQGLSGTVRGLSGTVQELSGTVRGLGERVEDLAESVEQTNNNVDLLVGAVNAFIERDTERSEEIRQLRVDYEQYKRENDNRFNTLLEEVRFLIRQLGENR
ncbi:hypothetical protein HC931_09740 [Candidatus Gracilibacteria bacterium]|nr:hypothetical protein [Candidatus Gracilibacteria bacterium]NJM86479.1 hypothetical protein [Hydrococcus sp. RU_2_2]NJP17964.1 hypothetical protein [Hydrococcus sp. CRU_1_1]